MQKIANLELLAALLDNASSSLRGESDSAINESNAILIDFVAHQLRLKVRNDELFIAVQTTKDTEDS
jgi:hypothetical protein